MESDRGPARDLSSKRLIDATSPHPECSTEVYGRTKVEGSDGEIFLELFPLHMITSPSYSISLLLQLALTVDMACMAPRLLGISMRVPWKEDSDLVYFAMSGCT